MRLSFVTFREGRHVVAQCLEHDLATQVVDDTPLADSIIPAIRNLILANVDTARRCGRKPFVGLPPAPARFRAMWRDRAAAVGRVVARVGGDYVDFVVPEWPALDADAALRRALRGVLVDALCEVAARDVHGLFSIDRRVASGAAREVVFVAGELLGIDRGDLKAAIAEGRWRSRTVEPIVAPKRWTMNRKEPNET